MEAQGQGGIVGPVFGLNCVAKRPPAARVSGRTVTPTAPGTRTQSPNGQGGLSRVRVTVRRRPSLPSPACPLPLGIAPAPGPGRRGSAGVEAEHKNPIPTLTLRPQQTCFITWLSSMVIWFPPTWTWGGEPDGNYYTTPGRS